MFAAIACGLALGAGLQAWRNVPPDGPLSSNGAVLVFVAGVALAYVGGRWRGRGRGGAVAVAHAEATAVAAASNTVNVAVFTPGQGAGQGVGRHAAGSGVLVPSEAAPWLGNGRPSLDESMLEGADLRDLGFELDAESVES